MIQFTVGWIAPSSYIGMGAWALCASWNGTNVRGHRRLSGHMQLLGFWLEAYASVRV